MQPWRLLSKHSATTQTGWDRRENGTIQVTFFVAVFVAKVLELRHASVVRAARIFGTDFALLCKTET